MVPNINRNQNENDANVLMSAAENGGINDQYEMTVIQLNNAGERVNSDETDRIPAKDRVNLCDISLYVISILSYIVDIGLDFNLAYRYFSEEKYHYFGFTMAVILIPAVINTAFSIRMYVQDGIRNTTSHKATSTTALCILVLVLQLAPVLRHFDSLQYAIKSRNAEKRKDIQNQRKYFELMMKEDSDAALLRVIECFLEAAPQQVLQITIILMTSGQGMSTFILISQLLAIGSSFGSMAWSMASYQRLIRITLKTKRNITWGGTAMQFMWHLLVTISRIMSISVIASAYTYYTIIALIAHWLVMTTWLILTENTGFCGHRRIYDFIFYSVFGMVYTFTHITLSEGKTRYKYLIYYTICFIENAAATIVWTQTADKDVQSAIYYQPIIYLNFIPFLLGILFMILFYKICHPSTGIRSKRQEEVL